MSATQAGYEAYLEYLGSLRASGTSYFLEGGQTVNFWAEYVDSRVQGQPLNPLRPFTSKDWDIWVSSDTWEKLKRDPQLRKGFSPADGQLGILTLSEDPPRVVGGSRDRRTRRREDLCRSDRCRRETSLISHECFAVNPLHRNPSQTTRMSHKSARIAAMIASFQGQDLDAHYLGFFDCFNRQMFYEAHDVLEDIWLADRHGANGNFYKGLIQLAGAFVHLQKNRLRPSAALFKLARTNLEKYPGIHERLNLVAVLAMIADWQQQLEQSQFVLNPLTTYTAPELRTTT